MTESHNPQNSLTAVAVLRTLSQSPNLNQIAVSTTNAVQNSSSTQGAIETSEPDPNGNTINSSRDQQNQSQLQSSRSNNSNLPNNQLQNIHSNIAPTQNTSPQLNLAQIDGNRELPRRGYLTIPQKSQSFIDRTQQLNHALNQMNSTVDFPLSFIATDEYYHQSTANINYAVKLRQPIPIRACEKFPSLQKKTDGANPLYNNYMFGAANGKKIKMSKRDKKRKNRGAHHNQSVECIGRSYNNRYNKNTQQQQSSQFLPEVVQANKHLKSGSLARYQNTRIQRKDDDIGSAGPTNGTLIQLQIYEDTFSDERNSQAISSSEKESKGDLQSQSSHSRKGLSYRKSNFSYAGGNIENLENLRNLYKAEKELRGIFQAVKQYEFPIIKDAEGNIKQIGKYQPKQKMTKIPPIRPQNPIVFDKIFRGQQDLQDQNQLQTINEERKIADEGRQLIPGHINQGYQSHSDWRIAGDQFQNYCDLQPLQKQWENSTIASSTFYSDTKHTQNDFNTQINFAAKDSNQLISNQFTDETLEIQFSKELTNLNQQDNQLQQLRLEVEEQKHQVASQKHADSDF
eukprot:403359764